MKSSSNEWLTRHVLTYSACFLPFGFGFACLTFVTHWATDYLTSRCTTKLWFVEFGKPYGINLFDWAKLDLRKRKWFFVMIGFDQLIHAFTLALTYKLIHG